MWGLKRMILQVSTIIFLDDEGLDKEIPYLPCCLIWLLIPSFIDENVRDTNIIKVVMGEHSEGGVNMLQNIDDAIFLLQEDYMSAHNQKLILCSFEQMFVLKIVSRKSDFCSF